MKQFISATLFALASSSVSARSIRERRQTSTPNADDIKNAVLSWQSDTADVSNFLDNAANTGFFSLQSSFTSAATDALNSEKDELTHKAVLDAELASSSELSDANDTLVTQGTFQNVVDILGDLTNLGLNQTSSILNDVNNINNGDNGIGGRCDFVLPAIDMYFAQAAQALINLNGDESLVGVTAVRPSACGSP